jgi:glucose uptake protein GlcU
MIALIIQLLFLNLIIFGLHLVLAKEHDLEQEYDKPKNEESALRILLIKILMSVGLVNSRSNK